MRRICAEGKRGGLESAPPCKGTGVFLARRNFRKTVAIQTQV
jgi:hypothetical protein